jgi:hypothetical protein
MQLLRWRFMFWLRIKVPLEGLDKQERTGQGILRTNQGRAIDQRASFEYASGTAP